MNDRSPISVLWGGRKPEAGSADRAASQYTDSREAFQRIGTIPLCEGHRFAVTMLQAPTADGGQIGYPGKSRSPRKLPPPVPSFDHNGTASLHPASRKDR